MVLLGRRGFGCMVMVGSVLKARRPSVRGSIEGRRETGLDYFGARYFPAAQGRFTSPDLRWQPHEQYLIATGLARDSGAIQTEHRYDMATSRPCSRWS